MELEPMIDKLKEAIEALADKAKGADKSDDAMKFAQAAENLAHAVDALTRRES